MAEPIVAAASAQLTIVLTDTANPGDAIGFDGTNWVRADADAATPVRAEFFALHRCATSGDRVAVAQRVTIYDSDAPYTLGALQFLSGTAGGHTQTNPVAAGAAVQVLGKAITTDTVFLNANFPHLTVSAFLAGAAAATAANYGYIFTADRNWRLVAAREVHRTAGTDAGAVTLDIEQCDSAEAQDSGVSMVSATISLKGTAATPVAVGPHATASQARLKPGQSVALKDTGVLTAVADVAVTLTFVEDL